MHQCSECGREDSSRVMPALCPACGALDSYEVPEPERVELVRADQLRRDERERRATGYAEIDTLLGGGFAAGTTVLLHGRDGSGKSRCALRWATAIGTTLCVAIEMGERLTAETAESAGADLARLFIADEHDSWQSKARAGGVRSVVLDSISVVEDEREQRALLRELERWTRDTEGHVFVVCHNTKGGQYLGPSRIGHWPDVRLQVFPKPAGKCRVAVKKSRTCPLGSCEASIVA